VRLGAGAARGQAQRLQKVLSDLGVASRREVERWIRAGRLTVNGTVAQLGMRVSQDDRLKLDGRPIRRHASARASAGVILCHRSPGEPLLPNRRGSAPAAPAAVPAAAQLSLAERLPRRAGRRFVSVSPMPAPDGGLELLTSDGALAARLQRRVGTLESEFSVRVHGELSEPQLEAVRRGVGERGDTLQVRALEAAGGQASNRWYRMVAVGASGREIRQLFERQGAVVVRVLRTRIGALALPRTLARGHWRALERAELDGLIGNRGSGP
jgi:23S rRNA pseudouridine2605 synthase